MTRCHLLSALTLFCNIARADPVGSYIEGIRTAIAVYRCSGQRWAGLPHDIPTPAKITFQAFVQTNVIHLLYKGNLLDDGQWRASGGISILELAPVYHTWAVRSDEWFSDDNDSLPLQEAEASFAHSDQLTLDLTGLSCTYSVPEAEFEKRELVQEIARQAVAVDVDLYGRSGKHVDIADFNVLDQYIYAYMPATHHLYKAYLQEHLEAAPGQPKRRFDWPIGPAPSPNAYLPLKRFGPVLSVTLPSARAHQE